MTEEERKPASVKTENQLRWESTEVPADVAEFYAEMPNEKLAKAWVVNGLLAALAGAGSRFDDMQAAMYQEIRRRNMMEKDLLS